MRALLLVLLMFVGHVQAAPPQAPTVPPEAQNSAHFDVEKATNAWLATVSPAAKARSDAYFEGGYWLILWDFLYGVAAAFILLQTGFSVRMRDFAERLVRPPWLRIVVYWLQYLAVTAVLMFPLTVYEGFFRERSYALLNQSFLQWLRDQIVGLAIVAIIGGLAYLAIVQTSRRAPRTWHLWGSGIAIVFLAVSIVLAPTWLAPLFNTYKPLQNPALKNQILSLARASGIQASNVYEVDASRQTDRVSANVSGMFGTERITLNDNLLNRCSPQAVLATMGHEMGHYVMHHVLYGLAFGAVAAMLFFFTLRWSFEWLLPRFGVLWGIRSISDTAATPLVLIVLLAFGFVFTPVSNTFRRVQEYEADLYGLNASRQPDGEAEVDLLLGEYRKLDPKPLEEFLFFDHPSGRTRIHAAMRWKAENLHRP